MNKKLRTIFFAFIFITIFLMKGVLAYEDNLFKFNLPSTYQNMSFNNRLYTFVNINDDKVILIYVKDDPRAKKSVWDIDESDIMLMTQELGTTQTISVNRKAKLGEEKALKYTLKDEEGEYMEMYILASNKYVYMIVFTGETLSDLNDSDYKMVKNSFKLKDSTTNWNTVYVLICIVIIILRFVIKNKRREQTRMNSPIHNGEIDYKNMTEEDLNKFNR